MKRQRRMTSVAPLVGLTAALLLGACATGDSRVGDAGPTPDQKLPKDSELPDDAKGEGQKPDTGEPCPSGGCDDGKTCTDDACVAGKCQYTVKTGFCLIDGTCEQDGAKKGTCLACKASVDNKAWSADTGLCADDGKSCTEASCDAQSGACEQTIKAGNCLVAGACLKDGEAPSGEECQACDSAKAQDALSPRADGTGCSADSLGCTDDICQSGQCKHPLAANRCLINGVCYQTGAKQPGSECSTCQPSKSTSAWSGAPDNTPCSADTLSCTDDVCQSGQCKHPTKSGSCLISGKCYASGTADPQNECLACNPLVAQDVFSKKANGQPCSGDNLGCTADTCQNGSCTHLLESTSCLISGVCYASGTANPVASCQHCDPGQHAGTWSQKAAGASCAADALSCTDDVCNASGTCTHPLKSGTCFINSTCYTTGAPSPGDSCSTCQPSVSTATFTAAADGTLCATDNLPCTNDVCRSGSCKHELLANRCIINGGCYAVDAAVDASGCSICAPSVSTSQATFAGGKACNDGDSGTHLDTCLAGSCKGFSAYNIELLASDTSTALHAVAAFSGGEGTWVAGERTVSGSPTGFVAKLNGTSSMSDISSGGGVLYAITDRMAVGAGGETAYWDGSNWYIASDVMTHVGTAKLNGVYGASVSGTRTFYVAGEAGTLSRCSTGDNGSSFSCQSVGSLAATTGLAGISGVANGATMGPLWAVRGETSEDIYHSTNGSSWSTAGPAGCADSGSNACAGTSGRLHAVFAKSATEVWAVGEEGLILRYDGSSWSKVSIPNLGAQTPQSAFTFRSVFASGDVVAFTGERIWNGVDRDMIILFYNSALDRFFAPQTAFSTLVTDPNKDSYRFNGVGGALPGAFYIVGSIWSSSSSEQRGVYLVRP